MPKKQKQNMNKKRGGQKKQKTPQKDLAPKAKPAEAASSAPVLSEKMKKSKHSLWRHLDPWVIGSVVFAFGIFFALFLVWGYQFTIAGSHSFISTTVAGLQSGGDNDQGLLPQNSDDGKVETFDGTRVLPNKTHHPVAVMFDNHVDARPQSGIQSASIVYETLVEGSITRFMGIFDYGKQDKIGPIRSARPYFTQWVDPLDAAYMHAGGSPEALQKINEYSIKNVYQGQYYWRDPGRPRPHNLYTSSDLMIRDIADNNWQASTTIRRWKFSDTPEKGTHSDGDKIHLHFSGNSIGSLVDWEYVPDTMMYKRFQAGVAHEDAQTGAQITAKTIVVQIIPPIVAIGDHGRLTLNVLGSGVAHIVFEGKHIEGTWKKDVVSSRTVFYDDNGQEVVFPRGNIFVEVIPSDREVTFE